MPTTGSNTANSANTESAGMPAFNTSQLMGMAALAAAMFNATSETKPGSNSNNNTANLVGQLGAVGGGVGALPGLQASTSATAASRQNTSTTASSYQANSGLNKAASLLAQSKWSNVGNKLISFPIFIENYNFLEDRNEHVEYFIKFLFYFTSFLICLFF